MLAMAMAAVTFCVRMSSPCDTWTASESESGDAWKRVGCQGQHMRVTVRVNGRNAEYYRRPVSIQKHARHDFTKNQSDKKSHWR